MKASKGVLDHRSRQLDLVEVAAFDSGHCEEVLFKRSTHVTGTQECTLLYNQALIEYVRTD